MGLVGRGLDTANISSKAKVCWWILMNWWIDHELIMKIIATICTSILSFNYKIKHADNCHLSDESYHSTKKSIMIIIATHLSDNFCQQNSGTSFGVLVSGWLLATSLRSLKTLTTLLNSELYDDYALCTLSHWTVCCWLHLSDLWELGLHYRTVSLVNRDDDHALYVIDEQWA